MKPTPVTATVAPFAVTANALAAGVLKLPLASTRSHCETGAVADGFVLMRFNSSNVGVRTFKLFAPTFGKSRVT